MIQLIQTAEGAPSAVFFAHASPDTPVLVARRANLSP